MAVSKLSLAKLTAILGLRQQILPQERHICR